MRRPVVPRRMHDLSSRESWDKVVLLLAFFVGVGGGITLKLLGIHPFITAGFAAAVLCLYAIVAYATTSLRLEPEVIGDNSYYLGFLFTLTSLSVTLYFVIEGAAEDRAKLIPEVISGFGVALVSTIVGVFIRVLMMQFRLDIVSRERETRVEIDQAARLLRIEMAQALQQMKFFTVESLQHSAEREAEFKRATDALVSGTQAALAGTARYLHQETASAFREQTAAAIDVIRTAVSDASEGALRQISVSFEEIGKTSEGLRASHAIARGAVEQANAALHQQTAGLGELVSQLSRRIRTISEEVESSGTGLARSIATAAARLDQSLADTTKRLDVSLASFELANRDAATQTHLLLDGLAARLDASTDRLVAASLRPTEVSADVRPWDKKST